MKKQSWKNQKWKRAWWSTGSLTDKLWEFQCGIVIYVGSTNKRGKSAVVSSTHFVLSYRCRLYTCSVCFYGYIRQYIHGYTCVPLCMWKQIHVRKARCNLCVLEKCMKKSVKKKRDRRLKQDAYRVMRGIGNNVGRDACVQQKTRIVTLTTRLLVEDICWMIHENDVHT